MPTERTAEQRWEEHREQLLAELHGANDVVVLIPGWRPVGQDEGLRWLQASHYEGFKVSHVVKHDGGKAVVSFTIWED